MAVATPVRKNVVIFGESGAGKSSVINLLMGRQMAPISDSAVGCTFDFNHYDNDEYRFYDTVGLSEGSGGSVTSKKAMGGLVKLLKSLTDGVSLLILVIEKGRIKKTLEENYKLFVDTICMGKVPVILMVTRCEDEMTMGHWWTENKQHFDRYGMKFRDTVSGCAGGGGANVIPEMVALRRRRSVETTAKLLDSITAHCLAVPWRMESLAQWLKIILLKVWNVLCNVFSWPSAAYWPKLKDVFVEQGYDTSTATILANDIYNEVNSPNGVQE